MIEFPFVVLKDTLFSGCSKQGKDVDLRSVYEGMGAVVEGKMSERELVDLEEIAVPGPGSCGGMYTANTMSCALEALGLALPNSSSMTAISAVSGFSSFIKLKCTCHWIYSMFVRLIRASGTYCSSSLIK